MEPMADGSVSIIIPAFNEAASLVELTTHIDTVLQRLGCPYEVLIIDDGSTDDTPEILHNLITQYPYLHFVRFRRNYGKAAALSEAFTRAQGDFLITIDADLQDSPEEIPALLEQLRTRYDVICGWKQNRQDTWTRILGSRFFNFVTALITGLKLHDVNCGLKGYRHQVVQELRLYGEMHRFIPVIARQRGFLVGEIRVQHFPRRYGQSRYGWSRSLSGLFDLITLVMLGRYTHKPLHFFGLLGLACEFFGLYILVILGIGWLQGQWIGNRPIFLVAIFLLLSGLQFIFFGLLAELLIYLNGQREDCSIDEEITGVMTQSDTGSAQRFDRTNMTLRTANSPSS
uniref:Glycosyl transferase n=1 Tax=uncultured bacterium F41-01 TaxID=1191437 RepID=I3VIP4_9BACT|nr:glycosyl transferase [uncultured bacterium F41-01]